MEVSRLRALRGPNLWCRRTAIEAIVACSESERAIGDMDAFETRLRARFPDIDILRPVGHDGVNSLAHILSYAALRLQSQAGCPVAFSRTAATLEAGVYQVVIEYTEEAVGRLAFELARALCIATMQDEPFDLDQALARLAALNEDVRLGPSTGAIVQAAERRGIPWRRLTAGSLVQFGWGCRQRRIHQIDPADGTVLRTIESDRFVTGVTWVDGQLWHGTGEGEESDIRRVDPQDGTVLERLRMPPGISVSGLEADGGDLFYCGGGRSGRVHAVKRPRAR